MRTPTLSVEVIPLPVSDVERALRFYVDQVGFHLDHDHKVTDDLRFVQLTPPGSACSIVIGTGITQMAPGSQKGLQVVVVDNQNKAHVRPVKVGERSGAMWIIEEGLKPGERVATDGSAASPAPGLVT